VCYPCVPGKQNLFYTVAGFLTKIISHNALSRERLGKERDERKEKIKKKKKKKKYLYLQSNFSN